VSIKGGTFDSDLAALGRRLNDTIFVLGGTDWVFCWLVFTNIDGFVFVSVLGTVYSETYDDVDD